MSDFLHRISCITPRKIIVICHRKNKYEVLIDAYPQRLKVKCFRVKNSTISDLLYNQYAIVFIKVLHDDIRWRTHD